MTPVKPLAEEQASAEIKPIYESMKQRFGRMPNFFGVMAHKPEVLKNFLPFYSSITGPGAVEQKYKELAYLKTSLVNGCEYCAKAHTASAKRIGITDEQIRALIFYQRSKLFDEKEKTVIRFADQVTRDSATICQDQLQELGKYFSEEQIVELALTVCVANFTNRVNNSLLSDPDLG